MSLAGKVAIITGCGNENGIGFVSAVLMGQCGCSLVVTSTTERIFERVEELKKEGFNAVGVIADLTEDEAAVRVVDVAIESFKRIDILVNNAGMTSVSKPMTAETGSLLSMNIETFRAGMCRNMDTAFLMSQAALPYLMRTAKGSGRIINISSTTGVVNATQDDVAYASAKAAIIGFTRATAIDLAAYGITVNAICPGWICTSSQSEFEALQGSATPLARSGDAHEVAHWVLSLALPYASYMTGQDSSLGAFFELNELKLVSRLQDITLGEEMTKKSCFWVV